MKQVAYVMIGILAGFLLAGALFIVTHLPGGQAVQLQPAPTEPPIEVHVVGAVVRPGVYSFSRDGRVQDAVTAAGGLLAEADPASINLAAKLEDGEQLEIPFQQGASSSRASSSSPFTVIGTSTPSSSHTDLININTASVDKLNALPGIGPTTAQKIIDYRQEHGPFSSIQDIMNVSGIGPATFDQIKNLITVQ